MVTCSSGRLARMVTNDSPIRSRSLPDSRSIALSSSPGLSAVSRTAARARPSTAETRLAVSRYPPPTGSICPLTTALIPCRSATSRASAAESGPASARCMRCSASRTACWSITRTLGDCERSTRMASVSDGPSVVSAVWFSKSASNSGSRSFSTPEASRVPTGPMPRRRIAV